MASALVCVCERCNVAHILRRFFAASVAVVVVAAVFDRAFC